MKRASVAAVLASLLLTALAATALAVTNFENAPSGTHFTRGNTDPVCTENEQTNTVSCTGTQVAGVGNTNATAALEVDYSALIVCRNPGNRNIVEPHSTSDSDVTEAKLFPSKNGRLTVPSLSETITTDDVEAAFTCPNPNWEQEITDITITRFTYSVTFDGFDEPFILITG